MSSDDQLMKSWEDLKTANDELLDDAKKNSGTPDPLLVERNEKISKEMDKHLAANEAKRSKIPSIARSSPDISWGGISSFNADVPTLMQADAAHSDDYGSAFFGESHGIITEANTPSIFLQNCTIYQIPSGQGQLSVNIIDDSEEYGNISSGWSLERTAAGGLNRTDAPIVKRVVIDAYHLYLQPTTTSKFQTFFPGGDDGVKERFTRKAINAINNEVDKMCLYGSGVDRPKGLFNGQFTSDPDVADKAICLEIITGSNSTITTDDVIRVQMALPSRYLSNAQWMMHQSTFGKFRLIKNGENYVFAFSKGYDGVQPMFLDFPVLFTKYMPTFAPDERIALFGDFKSCIIIDNPLELMVDDYAYKPLIAYYFTKWLGFNAMDLRALICLKVAPASP